MFREGANLVALSRLAGCSTVLHRDKRSLVATDLYLGNDGLVLKIPFIILLISG